jgi:hypothetical protein
MLQNSPQADGKRTNGQGKGGGPKTIAGRERQVAARVSNGVHFQSPVLPGGIESEADWEAHLASLEEALQPVGSWEKYCVYRVALSAWQFFRLVRHTCSIVKKSVTQPDNGFTSCYDESYVRAGDVGEVLRRPESSLEEELFKQRDFVLRVSALAGEDFSDITFTPAERRQILDAIIKQPVYDANGSPVEVMDDEDCSDEGQDEENDGVLANDVDAMRHNAEDANDEAADNEDPVVVPAEQLREEIGEITKFKGVELTEAVEELVDTLSSGINKRQHRLQVARAHIGACLIPDEKNVGRLTLYERQLDAVSRRYLNDLYRAQALRLGQPVTAPIALDVNFTGEQGNGQ